MRWVGVAILVALAVAAATGVAFTGGSGGAIRAAYTCIFLMLAALVLFTPQRRP